MYITLLNRIQNAQAARKETVKFPHSKFDEQVLSVLEREKFIAGFEKKGKNPKRFFDITLFNPDSKHGITGIRMISTPSRKIYEPYTRLRTVRQGYGISIVSTSQGVMTGKDARVKKVGGQVLFYIW
jgi:small subunit ribosomal protein S8